VAAMLGLRAYLHSAQPAGVGWGCLCRQGIGDTLRVCNKRLGARGGGPQGWGLTTLVHCPDLEDQLGSSDHCLGQSPAH
jgi:hypothetical protein